ncbi:hypothetical protein ACVW1K_000811 [Bacillus subtilis]|nr:hypothetical protein BSHJ0_03551 [Bacillus subtilis]CAF1733159.1 hypothetical protein NRS6103_01373 [Bacillus subtilis]CAF1806494.1 hypothetical protein NRS6127_01426 [Bacillus subtilis]CAF1865715.1 hypothetical protein NRS6183_00801 [Bacillus subtilis]CAF1878179.1 hypothetical protein NRS6206_00239 [Bacillus subtilis]
MKKSRFEAGIFLFGFENTIFLFDSVISIKGLQVFLN